MSNTITQNNIHDATFRFTSHENTRVSDACEVDIICIIRKSFAVTSETFQKTKEVIVLITVIDSLIFC